MNDTFLLGVEYFGIDVPVGGEGVAAFESARECGVGVEILSHVRANLTPTHVGRGTIVLGFEGIVFEITD